MANFFSSLLDKAKEGIKEVQEGFPYTRPKKKEPFKIELDEEQSKKFVSEGIATKRIGVSPETIKQDILEIVCSIAL